MLLDDLNKVQWRRVSSFLEPSAEFWTFVQTCFRVSGMMVFDLGGLLFDKSIDTGESPQGATVSVLFVYPEREAKPNCPVSQRASS